MTKVFTVPNTLSFLRILLALLVPYWYLAGDVGFAFTGFLVGCLTDFVDGKIARAFHMESALGELIDPIADKIFTWSMFILLFLKYKNGIMVAIAPALVVLCVYDVLVSYLRFFTKKRMKANWYAKWKTTLLLFSLTILIFSELIHQFLWENQTFLQVGAILLLWVAAFLAVLSASRYARRANGEASAASLAVRRVPVN